MLAEQREVSVAPRQIEPEKMTERVPMVATPRWVDRVDGWCKTQPGRATRSDAIRMLTDWALDAIEALERGAPLPARPIVPGR